MLRCLILSLIFFSCFISSRAQYEKGDSTLLYKKIETFSKKRKSTQLIYNSIFRPVTPTPLSIVKPFIYAPFEDKIIRNIYIITYDPFGYDAKDTSIVPSGLLE